MAFIEPRILDPDDCICEAIAFEVLRHATSKERKQIELQFSTLPLLPVQQPSGVMQPRWDSGAVTFDAEYERIAGA